MLDILEQFIRLLLQSEANLDCASRSLNQFLRDNKINVNVATRDRISAALKSLSARMPCISSKQAIDEVARGLHVCDITDVSFYG